MLLGHEANRLVCLAAEPVYLPIAYKSWFTDLERTGKKKDRQAMASGCNSREVWVNAGAFSLKCKQLRVNA